MRPQTLPLFLSSLLFTLHYKWNLIGTVCNKSIAINIYKYTCIQCLCISAAKISMSITLADQNVRTGNVQWDPRLWTSDVFRIESALKRAYVVLTWFQLRFRIFYEQLSRKFLLTLLTLEPGQACNKRTFSTNFPCPMYKPYFCTRTRTPDKTHLTVNVLYDILTCLRPCNFTLPWRQFSSFS